MEINLGIRCCGIGELTGIEREDPETLIKYVANQYFYEENQFAYLIFSCRPHKYNSGKNLSNFIDKHNLGQVVSLRSKQNPNSDNIIKMWSWSVNARNLKNFYDENKPRSEEKINRMYYSTIF